MECSDTNETPTNSGFQAVLFTSSIQVFKYSRVQDFKNKEGIFTDAASM
jgi:hypothetical protein